MRTLNVNFILILIFCLSCGSSQTITQDVKTNNKINCPTDGYCKTQVFKNSTLITKTDKFNTIYADVKKGENTVIQYLYKRNEIPNTMDSGYSEIVYIELKPNQIKDNTFKDLELSDVNAFYGRFCYCKDATGFFPITSGELHITSTLENKFIIEFEYNTLSIPQITTQFQISL